MNGAATRSLATRRSARRSDRAPTVREGFGSFAAKNASGVQ